MKKLAIATAVLASLAASTAFAEVTVDVYGDRSTKGDNKSTQGVEVGYGFDNGLGLSAEATTNKDLDLGASWKINYSESSYVKPSVNYVINKSESLRAENHNPSNPDGFYEFAELTGLKSDVAKVGLEFGSQMGDFFSSARIRYEVNVDKLSATHEIGSIGANGKLIPSETYSESVRSETARIDLLVGYNFENVTFTAKSINKNELNKDMKNLNKEFGTKNDKWSGEFKATVTAYDGVQPYIQYTHNKAFTKNGSDDQIIKIGTIFTF